MYTIGLARSLTPSGDHPRAGHVAATGPSAEEEEKDMAVVAVDGIRARLHAAASAPVVARWSGRIVASCAARGSGVRSSGKPPSPDHHQHPSDLSHGHSHQWHPRSAGSHHSRHRSTSTTAAAPTAAAAAAQSGPRRDRRRLTREGCGPTRASLGSSERSATTTDDGGMGVGCCDAVAASELPLEIARQRTRAGNRAPANSRWNPAGDVTPNAPPPKRALCCWPSERSRARGPRRGTAPPWTRSRWSPARSRS